LAHPEHHSGFDACFFNTLHKTLFRVFQKPQREATIILTIGKKMRKTWCILILSASILISSTASLSAREVQFALFPFELNSSKNLTYLQSGITAMLPSRISVPEKIEVLDPHLVQQTLTRDIGTYSMPQKIALAKKLGADFFLCGSLTKIGDTISIDTVLVDIMDSTEPMPVFIQSNGLDALIPEINNLAKKIQTRIIEGPPLADHMPSATPVALSRPTPAPAEPPPASTPVAEASIVPAPQAAAPLPPPVPTGQPTPNYLPAEPLFGATPAYEHSIKGFPLQSLACGDTDGDGTAELLAADDQKLYIYSINETELVLKATVATQAGENIVYVDVADLNSNGRAEIYVSSYEGTHATSFVIEYTDGEYTRLAESLKYFFRNYTDYQGNRILLGQSTDLESPFTGSMWRFVWKDGKPFSTSEVIFPGDIAVFGVAEGDIDQDSLKEYVAFTRGLFSATHQLKIYAYTGRIEWKDVLHLGGSTRNFNLQISHDIEKLEDVPMRVYCEDINADGRLDVIVTRNSKKGTGFFGSLSSYDQSEMLCLHWDGSDLVTNWSSEHFEGYVTDYLVADIDADGQQELLTVVVTPMGLIGKATNTVKVFRQTP